MMQLNSSNSLSVNRKKSSEKWIVIILIVTDLAAVSVSFLLSFLIRRQAPLLPPLKHGLDIYLNAWPALLLWPLIFWRDGLYPGFWLSTREELRRSVSGTTITSVLAMALTFATKTGPLYSRPIIVGGWLISIAFVPAFRFICRRVMTKIDLSGPRTVILGAGQTAAMLVRGIRRRYPPALNSLAMFDDDLAKHGTRVEGVPVVGCLEKASEWASTRGIRTAVVAMPGVPREQLIPIIEGQSKVFQRIIVIPDLFGVSAADVDSHEISGMLALEMRQNLLYGHNRIAKRLIDLLLLMLGVLFILPMTTLIAIAILIESGWPVFFKHERIGRGGKSFATYKYRTMVRDAQHVLETALEESEELKREWESNQKLRDDPRLTKIGKIVRRLSLDELPQLWNVLKGEMSLVGPRPITKKEIERYGDSFDLYTQVLPGLTGLWQVSGRSDLSYAERVWLDTHYVRNWSIWLDLVILVRTVWVVIAGIGAY